MTKKNIAIIQRMLSGVHGDRAGLKKIGTDGGFFYAMDGYRLVQFSDCSDDLPLFTEEEKHLCPNYRRYVEDANRQLYSKTVEIPYKAEDIRRWHKRNLRHDKRIPFCLGINAVNNRTRCFGINGSFLADAMETTKSNRIQIPDDFTSLMIQGNGFTWIIMPVMMEWARECNKTMTIPVIEPEITYL